MNHWHHLSHALLFLAIVLLLVRSQRDHDAHEKRIAELERKAKP